MNGTFDQSIEHVAATLGTARRGGLLWVAVLLAAALDAATTAIGVAIGLPEGNPLVGAAIAVVGVAGLVAIQAGFVAAVTGLVLAADQYRVSLLGVAAVLGALPVAVNLVAISVVAGTPAAGVLFEGLLAAVAVVACVLAGYAVVFAEMPRRRWRVEGS
jgi:hypothetical protein